VWRSAPLVECRSRAVCEPRIRWRGSMCAQDCGSAPATHGRHNSARIPAPCHWHRPPRANGCQPSAPRSAWWLAAGPVQACGESTPDLLLVVEQHRNPRRDPTTGSATAVGLRKWGLHHADQMSIRSNGAGKCMLVDGESREDPWLRARVKGCSWVGSPQLPAQVIDLECAHASPCRSA
jgi:hypothetical protein